MRAALHAIPDVTMRCLVRDWGRCGAGKGLVPFGDAGPVGPAEAVREPLLCLWLAVCLAVCAGSGASAAVRVAHSVGAAPDATCLAAPSSRHDRQAYLALYKQGCP